MLKLLIYTHEFPPFNGGAGIYSYDLALGLARLGIDTHVAIPGPEAPISIDGVQLHCIPVVMLRAQGIHQFMAALQIRENFDAILLTERRAQEVFSSLPTTLFRYVAVIHGTEILDYFSHIEKPVAVPRSNMAQLYENAFLCIAGSHATGQLIRKHGDVLNINPQVVQYGIDLDRMLPADPMESQFQRNRFGKNVEIVFSLGRLGLDKGQDTLIKAFKILQHSRPHARLLIGGTGPQLDYLKTLRMELSLEAVVEFLGPVSQRALPSLFESCDVFALPSRSDQRWEGFGLVFLEAAYYGKACVGGNEGGVPEAIVNGITGLVVNPRNETEVAAAIESLLDDKQVRHVMGQQGRQRVLDYYHSQRMAEETLGLISHSLPPPKPFSRFLLMLLYPILTLRSWCHGVTHGRILRRFQHTA